MVGENFEEFLAEELLALQRRICEKHQREIRSLPCNSCMNEPRRVNGFNCKAGDVLRKAAEEHPDSSPNDMQECVIQTKKVQVSPVGASVSDWSLFEKSRRKSRGESPELSRELSHEVSDEELRASELSASKHVRFAENRAENRLSLQSWASMPLIEAADTEEVMFKALPEWSVQDDTHRLNSICSRASNIALNSSGSTLASKQNAMTVLPTELMATFEHRNLLGRCWNRLMLQPSSIKHLIWELAGVSLITYDVVVIPLEFFNPKRASFMIVMAWIGCVFWTLDICISFLTGHLQAMGTVEIRPSRVARRYVTTWLPLDLSCVVVDWVTLANFGRFRSISSLRFLKFTRIMSLLRLLKAPEIARFITENIRSDNTMLLLTIFKNIMSMLVLAHFIACLWFHFGSGDSDGKTGWVAKYQLKEMELQDQYSWSLHWALAQFTGELVFGPENREERTFVVIVLFVTFLCSVMFVGTITTSLTQLMMLQGKAKSQLSKLRRYLTHHKVSTSLSIRMQRNASFRLLEQRQGVSEKSVEALGMISELLIKELHFELYSPILFAHPFFHRCNEEDPYPSGLSTLCHTAVSHLALSRGDVVFHNCEAPAWPRMFFCTHGKLRYQQQMRLPTHMQEGEWASEAVLWTKWMHCGTLQAIHETTFLVLDANKFLHIFAASMFSHCKDYAAVFVSELNQTDHSDLTDLKNIKFEERCMSWVFPSDRDSGVHRVSGHRRSWSLHGQAAALFGVAGRRSFSRVLSRTFSGYSEDTDGGTSGLVSNFRESAAQPTAESGQARDEQARISQERLHTIEDGGSDLSDNVEVVSVGEAI